MHHPKLEEFVRRDPSYPLEAYDFVRDAIRWVLRSSTTGQFSAGELMLTIPTLARREFGMLAPTVFRGWNLRRSTDIARIIANLVSMELLTAGGDDGLDDFENTDLIAALGDDYRIQWPLERLERR